MIRATLGAWLIAMAACSGAGSDTTEGVVTNVVGDLTTVASFSVVTPGGDVQTFEPQQGVLFNGNAPISHLTEHMLTGQQVVVRYRTLDDGTLIAIEVGDA